jgi:hypothetical protein
MWVFEAGRTTRYRCGFESGGNQPVRLTPVDSIEGVGWFTTDPTKSDTGER